MTRSFQTNSTNNSAIAQQEEPWEHLPPCRTLKNETTPSSSNNYSTLHNQHILLAITAFDLSQQGASVDIRIYTTLLWPQQQQRLKHLLKSCQHPTATLSPTFHVYPAKVEKDLCRYHKQVFYNSLDSNNYTLLIYIPKRTWAFKLVMWRVICRKLPSESPEWAPIDFPTMRLDLRDTKPHTKIKK